MLKCRACDTSLGEPFLSLGNSPLSNAYLSKDDLRKMELYYPLEVYVCEKCYLVQLEEFETAKNIFSYINLPLNMEVKGCKGKY